MNRRKFIYSTAMVSGMPLLKGFGITGDKEIKNNKRDEGFIRNISLGIKASANNPEEDLKIVRDLGFSTCQLSIGAYTPGLATRLKTTLKKYKLTPITLICMGPGVYKWNLKDGPSTIGLVPPLKIRPERIERLQQGIDFCKAAGIPAVHAHFGFIPENPKDLLYTHFIAIMKNLGEYAKKKGIDIYFETGQETPITLLRAIEDIGTGNLFVNCDVANFVLYGKANSLDATKILAKYIKSFHAKDGFYPTDPYGLGKEALIPNGVVDFPGIITFLKQINFKGNITIEVELSGTNKDYILKTKKYLDNLISSPSGF